MRKTNHVATLSFNEIHSVDLIYPLISSKQILLKNSSKIRWSNPGLPHQVNYSPPEVLYRVLHYAALQSERGWREGKYRSSGEGRQKRKASLDDSISQILSLKLGLCLAVHMFIEIRNSVLCRHAHVTSKKQHHRNVPYSEKERACRIEKKQSGESRKYGQLINL